MKRTMLITALAVSVSTLTGFAQQDGPLPRDGNRPHHPPLPLVIAVLDANHDHVIDAAEIANAAAALKNLDTNGDGKLTFDELFPPPPDNEDVGEPPVKF